MRRHCLVSIVTDEGRGEEGAGDREGERRGKERAERTEKDGEGREGYMNEEEGERRVTRWREGSRLVCEGIRGQSWCV